MDETLKRKGWQRNTGMLTKERTANRLNWIHGSQKAQRHDFKEAAETHTSTVVRKWFDDHSGPGATRFLENRMELPREVIASLCTWKLSTISCLNPPCPAMQESKIQCSLHSREWNLSLLKRSECRSLTAWVALSHSQSLFNASCNWDFPVKHVKVLEWHVGYRNISRGSGTWEVSMLGTQDEDRLDRFRGGDLKTNSSNS